MQLILVDCETNFSAYDTSTSDFGYYSSNSLFDYGTVEKVVLRPGSVGGTAAVDLANQLVVDIMTNQEDRISALRIYLSSMPPFRDAFTLSVKSDTVFDILKELRDRFQDKVNISVNIKCTKDAQECEEYGIRPVSKILNSRGVEISADNTCDFGSVTLKNKDAVEALKWMEVNVQVIAHISDEDYIPKVRMVSVHEKNRRILEEELFTDVVITAANGVEIKAHRSFLVASSSVFEKMFGSKMEEAKTGTIDMTDVSENGVRAFLRCIYFNDTIAIDEDLGLVFEIFYTAHKYDVQALEMLMMQHLLLERKDEEFGTDVAFKMYMFVRNIDSLRALKAKVIRILGKKVDELKELPEYNELCETSPGDAEELKGLIAS